MPQLVPKGIQDWWTWIRAISSNSYSGGAGSDIKKQLVYNHQEALQQFLVLVKEQNKIGGNSRK